MQQCDYGTQNKRIRYVPSLGTRSKSMCVHGIRMGTGSHQAQKTDSSKYTIYVPWRKWKYSGDRWVIFVPSAGIHNTKVSFCQVSPACIYRFLQLTCVSHTSVITLYLTGGYNGSLIYWLCNHNQAPHTLIADAHRQSIDVIAWHPAGHCVGTASHDGILKFWCREPPGAQKISIQ